jgi:hypothetical protein
LPAGVNFAFFLGQGTDMSLTSFVQAHAAHADWRVALAHCQRQLQTQIAARAAQLGESAPFTLGWCYRVFAHHSIIHDAKAYSIWSLP